MSEPWNNLDYAQKKTSVITSLFLLFIFMYLRKAEDPQCLRRNSKTSCGFVQQLSQRQASYLSLFSPIISSVLFSSVLFIWAFVVDKSNTMLSYNPNKSSS